MKLVYFELLHCMLSTGSINHSTCLHNAVFDGLSVIEQTADLVHSVFIPSVVHFWIVCLTGC